MTTRPRDLQDKLIAWHRNDANRPLLHASLTLSQVVLMAAAVWTWHRGDYALLVGIWLTAILVAHNKLIAFHETAHGLLHPVRWINELIGEVLGLASMVPLTAYRIVHARHHAFLGTERDSEFWPFVDPGVPRWRRVVAVIGELGFGYFYDPFVFARGVWTATNVPAAQRRRVVVEYLACGLFWSGLIVVLTLKGWWMEFCVAFFIPAYCAAILNSVRRMTEHIGMLGDTVESKTRSVAPVGHWNRLVSGLVLHVDHHGAHHRYGRIPYYRLPAAAAEIIADESHVFPSYWRALRDMLPHLADPRIGAQWRRAETAPEPVVDHFAAHQSAETTD